MDSVLIVVAKEPSPGRTKTRLCPPLEAEQAAEFYRCLLLDTLDTMARVDRVRHAVAYSPSDAEPYFRRLAPAGFDLIPQIGRNLGERLDNALRAYLQQGYQQAVVMNSDGPTLPLCYLEQSFQWLRDPGIDVVLGPSADGGYYLIGLKRPCSPLFDVVMSTATVLQETLEHADQQGLRTVCLPPWYDVDTPEDLKRLRVDLASQPDDVAVRTRQFVAHRLDHPAL